MCVRQPKNGRDACIHVRGRTHAGEREARCFISNRGTLSLKRDAFARRAARAYSSRGSEGRRGTERNEWKTGFASLHASGDLTIFIVFPCSIERNVTLPPPLLLLLLSLAEILAGPSFFDISGFSLFLFFSPLFSLYHRESIVKHFAAFRGHILHVWHMWKGTGWEKGRRERDEEKRNVLYL